MSCRPMHTIRRSSSSIYMMTFSLPPAIMKLLMTLQRTWSALWSQLCPLCSLTSIIAPLKRKNSPCSLIYWIIGEKSISIHCCPLFTSSFEDYLISDLLDGLNSYSVQRKPIQLDTLTGGQIADAFAYKNQNQYFPLWIHVIFDRLSSLTMDAFLYSKPQSISTDDLNEIYYSQMDEIDELLDSHHWCSSLVFFSI